jgi:hypothetical protein
LFARGSIAARCRGVVVSQSDTGDQVASGTLRAIKDRCKGDHKRSKIAQKSDRKM